MWYLFFITIAVILFVRIRKNPSAPKEEINNPAGKSAETSLLYCRKCYACISACPNGALYTDDKDIPLTDISKCVLCGNCVSSCPSDARSICSD